MFKSIKEFLENLLKTGKSGITTTEQATEAARKLKEASEESVKKTGLGDPALTGKYDETTPPGQFKEQTPIIDQEGNVKTRVFSYNPETFTETQKRTGVGSFSDESLREQYFDEGFDATESLEEFIIRKRGITPEARAAELREKGRIQKIEPAPKGATFEEAADDLMVRKIETETIPYITNIAKSTGRDPKDVRQLIVDRMNEGYPPGDPKRVTIDDDARINAHIESQLVMDEIGFSNDLIEDVLENTSLMGETGNPMLDDLLKQERELIEKSGETMEELKTIRARTDEVKEMVEGMGLDTSGIDFDIIKNSDDINAVRAEADKLRKLMSSLMGGGMDDLAMSGNLEKAMTSISGQARADMALAQEMAEMARTPGELETAIKRMEEIQKAYEESVRTGVYESPFSPKRILNAKGGRIGFEEGGGPKMTRRGFLGAMGAGLASLFMPRAGKEIAEIVAKGATKAPLTAEGMPIWFPSLVDKIRKEGKLKKADYASMKSGEGVDSYTFTDPSLPNKQIFMEEDLQTGAITISGRGDDMQIAELRFIPGEESIMVGEKGSKVSKNPNMFEAEEFMKGPGEGIGDYENFGGMDDMRFGVDTWADLVKAPEQKLKEAADKFGETQRNPNPNVSGKDPKTGEEFAKGGRVGYNMGGGVQTLFRRKAS
jgi:hypothetical protein